MAETTMRTPSGDWQLHRAHTSPDSPLQAWSAADRAVLESLDALGDRPHGRVLIVNDAWGALTVGLADHVPTLWTDSAMARVAIDANLARNGLAPMGSRAVTGDQAPVGPFDTVVLAIPRSKELFAHQLRTVASVVAAGATVIGAGMSRHLRWNVRGAMEAALGAEIESRGVRSARLFRGVIAEPCPDSDSLRSASTYTTDRGVTVCHEPGVFSAGRLDDATRLLIDHAVDVAPVESFVDLGCGAGVVAASLAVSWPAASVVLADASDLAISAARRTWDANSLDPQRASFIVADGLTGLAADSVDLVVTNPPSHVGNAVDLRLTEWLLGEAVRVTRPGGTVLAVGQRHLELHRLLRRQAGEARAISGHRSHVVVAAVIGS